MEDVRGGKVGLWGRKRMMDRIVAEVKVARMIDGAPTSLFNQNSYRTISCVRSPKVCGAGKEGRFSKEEEDKEKLLIVPQIKGA